MRGGGSFSCSSDCSSFSFLSTDMYFMMTLMADMDTALLACFSRGVTRSMISSASLGVGSNLGQRVEYEHLTPLRALVQCGEQLGQHLRVDLEHAVVATDGLDLLEGCYGVGDDHGVGISYHVLQILHHTLLLDKFLLSPNTDTRKQAGQYQGQDNDDAM